MTRFYTSSKGESVEIAAMPFSYLVSAHKKAVATEERKHQTAHINGTDYENPEREAEIDAMSAEIERRNEAHAKEQDDADRA